MRYVLTTKTLKRNRFGFGEAFARQRPHPAQEEAPCPSPQDVNLAEYSEYEATTILSTYTGSVSASKYEHQEPDSIEVYEEKEAPYPVRKMKRLRHMKPIRKEQESIDDIIMEKLNEDGYYDEIPPSDSDVRFEKPRRKIELWKYAAVAALFIAAVTVIVCNISKLAK